MPKQVVDPWLVDDGFSRIDFGANMRDLRDPDVPGEPIVDPRRIVQNDPVLTPEIIASEIPQEPSNTSLEPDGPEIIEIPGEGSVELRKTSKGWEAVVSNLGGGEPQVYKGNNKNEVLVALAKAQLNTTKKIRSLNRENRSLKQTTPVPAPSNHQPTQPTSGVRELTADEKMDIKLQMEADPTLAFQKWFQLSTNMTLDELQSLRKDAAQGRAASIQLLVENVGRAFVTRNPDYSASEKNFTELIKYLAKYKLNRPRVETEDAEEVMHELASRGLYTVENLEEAFTESSQDGSLERAPRVAPPVTPPPAPQGENVTEGRIVHSETRPRAAFGLRVTSAPAPPAAPQAPSVEDLQSMSDDQIYNLMAATRRHIIANRRN